MRVTLVRPRAELAPHVQSFTVVETGAEPAARTLLPDSSVILGFRFQGSAREHDGPSIADASLTGLRGAPRRMLTAAKSGIVLATFRPGHAALFFREPLHHLYGGTVSSEDVLPRASVARVLEEIGEARDHTTRIAAFERFLLATRIPERGDDLVQIAAQRIRRSYGAERIAAIASALGLSRDRLEKRFRAAVGATPKQLATIVRMQRAVELVRSGARSWTEVALEAGYFDQSHFIREFKKLAGTAPREFFSSVDHC